MAWGENADRVTFALEHDLFDIAQILAIKLERLWYQTRCREPIDVVRVEDVRRMLLSVAA